MKPSPTSPASLRASGPYAATQMSSSMGPAAREQFLQLVAEFDKKALEDAISRSMAKHFTVGEIEALTRFYASPEGKSVMKKMAPYLADVMPVIQAQMTVAARRIQERAEAAAPAGDGKAPPAVPKPGEEHTLKGRSQ